MKPRIQPKAFWRSETPDPVRSNAKQRIEIDMTSGDRWRSRPIRAGSDLARWFPAGRNSAGRFRGNAATRPW